MDDPVSILAAVGAVAVASQLFQGSVKVLKQGEAHHTPAEYKSEDAYKKLSAPYASSDRKKVMAPRVALDPKSPASNEGCPPATLPQLFKEAVGEKKDMIALMVERPLPAIVGKVVPPALPLAQWKSWTFGQYYDECRTVARAMIALGLEPFDGVNVFGFNSPEWLMGELAAIMAGGVAAGIYPTDMPDQVVYKSQHSSASIAVVENEAKLQIFMDNKEQLPKLKAVIVWAAEDPSKLADFAGVKVVQWSQLAEIGAKVSEEELDKRTAALQPGNVCTYIYTSGTTGNPKAVMISHDNIIFSSTATLYHLDFLATSKGMQERVLSFLPLSHVAGMMMDIVIPLVLGAKRPGYMTVAFARPYDLKMSSIGDRLRCVQPTMFLGVPRVWEKIAEKMKAIGKSTKGIKKVLATWAKAKGLEHARNCQMGGSGAKPAFYGLANKLVLSKVKMALGLNQCKFGFTGAAPITTETLEYFGQLGIQINEIYGMSECTGTTSASTDAAHVWGSCGWACEGVELKVFKEGPGKNVEADICKDLCSPSEEEQGEICFRGRHIMMGYMANPDLGAEHVKEIDAKNNDAIDSEGWLHSGDKGAMDARGMLKITGRYKELIIGAGGENIAPVPIEDNIKKLCPAVSNIMMVGDKRKFNVAMVTLKAQGANGELPGGDLLDGDAVGLVEGVTTITQACASEKFIDLIRQAIVATNKNGQYCPSNASAIQKFTILPRDFSSSTGELTPTLKTRRGEVEKANAKLLDLLYDAKGDYHSSI
mmetsp:Transcript_49195/g.72149  ORF Transcript_49195/g.72149 Transcript_49195/m.72149 type:complete len:764 (-) Transcript_49195:375-2666(-)|eukprot:CAMPEP_0179435286 /NCGR_PEP_ID=MMETSP0799-20121207/19433_1 /TAXON_ID=46947 /ORGANISM="Geminigera cryophila, Strain CCMP2564" /LENGTH=763 /DNA_ID=CAMNT_0021214579 /DNA_START=66 /DNA_END=2357 /DNA_ORIENTATION=+